jgi:hypothetical protein
MIMPYIMIGMKKMRKKSEKVQNVNVDEDESDGRNVYEYIKDAPEVWTECRDK